MRNWERKSGRVKVRCRQTETDYWLEIDLLHPLIKGGDSKRYNLSRTKRLILFPYEKEGEGMTGLLSITELKNRYPLTYAYFLSHKTYLENRENGRMKGKNWYGYGRTQALDVMLLPKIFTPDIAPGASFSLDETGEIFFTGGVAGGYGILVKSEIAM